jgi:NAD(P)-dependent dehydrogenase (short-subunit alcohol dehydrogenase family)
MSQPAPASLPLAGKAALVTGGGSGIGLACAKALARDGASVTITGRSPDRLAAGLAELEPLAVGGAVVQSTAGDVVDEQAVESAVHLAAEPAGGLHVAVASAGTGTVGPVIAMPLDEWNRVVETNLTGTFLLFKHAGAAIAKAGGGAMVGISSIASPITHRYMAPYSVSKAGIDTLVKITADELGRAGVRVCSVRPGIVQTEMGDHAINDPHILADYLEQMPISRVGTVDDVAAAVRFLCGPEASWITGQCLGVDGGHALRRGPDFEPLARALYGDQAIDAT